MESIFKKIALGVLAATLITACTKKDDDNKSDSEPGPGTQTPATPPPNPNVAPNEVLNAAGCLDIPAYLQRVQHINTASNILVVTTDVRATSKKSLHHNYLKQLAFGAFSYEEKPVVDMPEFWPVTQTGCETMLFTKTDGTQEEFKIIKSSETELTAKKENGEMFHYRYLSPNRIQITSEFLAFDHCNNNPQVRNEVTRVFDWSGARPEVITPTSPLMISESMLTSIAEAVGYDVNQLYTTTEEGKSLVVAKLHEMISLPPLDAVRACRDPGLEPEPPPVDPNNPNPPANPGEPGVTPENPTPEDPGGVPGDDGDPAPEIPAPGPVPDRPA